MNNKNTISTPLLIKYIYHETSVLENERIEAALMDNWALNEQMNALEKAHRNLPKVKFAPENSTIQDILKYSSETPAPEPFC